MSGNHTPTSELSSSSGSRVSYRGLDSNTTPSPSGGNRSPTFNPRALSNRLAMSQTSQSLSQAAASLAIAAQAMSKAAASLAAVSGYEDEDYAHAAGASESIKDWPGTPDWAQPSYNLSLLPATSVHEIYAVDEGYRLSKPEETPLADEIFESSQQPSQQECSSGPERIVDSYHSEGVPLIGAQPSTSQSDIDQQSSEAPISRPISNNPSDPARPSVKPADLVTPSKKEINQAPKENTTKESKRGKKSKVSKGIPTEPSHTPKQSGPKPSGSNVPLCRPIGPTRISLKRGFDSLPALCCLAERRTKTVCIYNYPGTAPTITSIALMLRQNTKLPVIMSETTKQDKLAAAAKKFNLAASGILLWTSCKKLFEITGLADSPDIQLIHIGEPLRPNLDIVCSMTTVILSENNFGQPQRGASRQYSLDALNNICNQQGPTSPLQPFRVWLRSHFSRVKCAREVYWDWVVQRRKMDPSLGAVEIVRLANRFAEEFLLRGESGQYGDPVGGRVTVTAGHLKGHKMEAAVKAGLLLVS